MKVSGEVLKTPMLGQTGVTYDIIDDEKIFHIVSTGKQAKKDIVFVREGQSIEVTGVAEGNTIKAKRGYIDIYKEISEYENR